MTPVAGPAGELSRGVRRAIRGARRAGVRPSHGGAGGTQIGLRMWHIHHTLSQKPHAACMLKYDAFSTWSLACAHICSHSALQGRRAVRDSGMRGGCMQALQALHQGVKARGKDLKQGLLTAGVHPARADASDRPLGLSVQHALSDVWAGVSLSSTAKRGVLTSLQSFKHVLTNILEPMWPMGLWATWAM